MYSHLSGAETVILIGAPARLLKRAARLGRVRKAALVP
jgi:hypothetical protein